MSKEVMLDEKELDAIEVEAEKEINGSEYVHTLSKPFEYEGKTYEELVFDFYSLTGNDELAIEEELGRLGKPVIAPELSGEFLTRMAAKACRQKVGGDFISALPIKDFFAVKNRARSFLLRSEL